jgi:hypothetical protein
MNLMLNAIEAMKDTGGVLTVKSRLADDSQIQISVNDTGPGLPPGNADQIFDAFFTTKRKAAAWGWQSASRSSNRMAEGFGPTATAGLVRCSTSPCQRLPQKQALPWVQRDSTSLPVGHGPSRRHWNAFHECIRKGWWAERDSNPRHPACKAGALTN